MGEKGTKSKEQSILEKEGEKWNHALIEGEAIYTSA